MFFIPGGIQLQELFFSDGSLGYSSHSLHSLEGVIGGDTRSLDNSSFRVKGRSPLIASFFCGISLI